MDTLLNMRFARFISACIAGCFLVIHLAMIALFSLNGVTPMVDFNIFSIAFYIATFFLIYRGMLRTFVIATYLEVIAHMTLAVYFVGWGSGFQVTLIGMSAFAFFAEYACRCLYDRASFALPLCVFGMCAYLVVYVVGSFYPPHYTLSESVSFWLQITWGVVTFVVSIVILQLFALITFNSQNLLSNEAKHDKLTGLPNRYFMGDYLNELMNSDVPGIPWVAMVDIDDFKVVNDTYGHLAGDEVLKGLVKIIAADGSDVKTSRWGGEEFLLAGKASSVEEIYEGLEGMRVSIAEHGLWYEECRLRITVTIGAAMYEQGDTVIAWINRADKNLYQGKQNGKNQVVM